MTARDLASFLCLAWLLASCAGTCFEDRALGAVSFDFEDADIGAVPAGFRTGMTGQWRAAEWAVRRVDGNAVFAHEGFWDQDPDGVFPVAWVDGAIARDFDLGVRLFPMTPPTDVGHAVHDGAGVVFRFRDPANYYLVRAVPHETRVRIYKVEDGKRSTLGGKDIEIAIGRWHQIDVKGRGNTFEVFLNGEILFTQEDETFADAGSFGLWCKPNNVTYYDDLKVVMLGQ